MKKSIKTAIPSILALSIVTSTAQTSEAMTYYDIYDEKTGEYYSAMYDEETGEEWIDLTPIPYYEQGSESEVGDGKYKGYNLYYKYPNQFSIHNDRSWWWKGSSRNGYTINWVGDFRNYSKATIKVPDKINRTDVIGIKGGCYFKAFDLNPENKYMKCVDNVIFSKDGKILMSYAKYDERTEYIIPDGTEIIAKNALSSSRNLTSVIIPDTVKKIEHGALSINNLTSIKISCELEVIPDSCFWSANELASVTIPHGSKLKRIEGDAFQRCHKLSELYLPSFDIEIDRSALGELYKAAPRIKLKSYVQSNISRQNNGIKWDKIPNASYYEIYRKLCNGEYKLLGKTKSTSHSFTALKSGTEYTFAVKPIAVIPAANYNKEKDEGRYPETFTIEGTMSEDITVTGM